MIVDDDGKIIVKDADKDRMKSTMNSALYSGLIGFINKPRYTPLHVLISIVIYLIVRYISRS